MNCNSEIITAKKIIYTWRLYTMAKSMMNVVKGVAAGLAVGVAAGYIGAMSKSQKRKGRKIANKAIRNVSEILDGLAKA